MGKIGSLEYPEITFSEAVSVVQKMKEQKIQTVAALSEVLGHKNATSGTFLVKLAALNKYYGLTDQTKAEIRPSKLGERIVYKLNESEWEEACREAILRVQLFRDLFNSLGAEYHPGDFKQKILMITSASREELDEKAPKIEKLYVDALRHLKASPSTKALEVAPPPGSGRTGRDESSPDVGAIPAPVAGKSYEVLRGDDGTFVRVPLDPEAIEDVQGHLEVWMKKARRLASKNSEAHA